MRIIIKHDTPENGITLPINYHHILQSIIYAHMRDTEFKKLHEEAFAYEKREYRMFTFSELYGKFTIQNKKITFFGKLAFKIASPNAKLISILSEKFKQDGITYGDIHCEVVEVIEDNQQIEDNEMDIKMISPICIYSTNKQTKKTIFYEPGTKGFEEQLKNNFVRKYCSYFGYKPESVPSIKVKCVLPRDRKVTNYKGFMITAWMGQYHLQGNPHLLNFWLDTGIGGKNAEGFGMFERC